MKTAVLLFWAIVVQTNFLGHAIAQDGTAQPEPGKQVELSFKTSDGGEIGYLLYLPKDYDATSDKLVPAMLFLHGRGESNGTLSQVAAWGPPKLVRAGLDLPLLVVSPQCPKEDLWNSEVQLKRLIELMDEITSNYAIDENKMYVTGLSMGGDGSWALSALHPKKFAAVVPICGVGEVQTAEQIKDIPIWVWHGEQDPAVPFGKSVAMVNAIKEAGGTSIKFTTLEGVGHNCWAAAYATPQLYRWMLEQSTAPTDGATGLHQVK